MNAQALKPQLRQALLKSLPSSLREQKGSLQQGFTLVELMVVIVIIGILSAVALPQFLGLKDRAKLNTQIAEGSGLAKECAAAIIADGPYPADYAGLTTVTGLDISGNCNDGVDADGLETAPAADIVYSTEAATAQAYGSNCGQDKIKSGAAVCRITVEYESGQIAYEAVAS